MKEDILANYRLFATSAKNRFVQKDFCKITKGRTWTQSLLYVVTAERPFRQHQAFANTLSDMIPANWPLYRAPSVLFKTLLIKTPQFLPPEHF